MPAPPPRFAPRRRRGGASPRRRPVRPRSASPRGSCDGPRATGGAARQRERRLRRPVDGLGDVLEEAAEHRVPGGRDDRAVEQAVPVDPVAVVGDRALHRLQRIVHRLEVLGRPAPRRQPRRLDLDALPDLPDHRVVGLGADDLVGQARGQVGRRPLEVDAVAVPDVDEPHDAQRGERLADRGAAHAELLKWLLSAWMRARPSTAAIALGAVNISSGSSITRPR